MAQAQFRMLYGRWEQGRSLEGMTDLHINSNGDGSRQPTEKELAIAKAQGENFGKVVNTYMAGKSA